MFSSVKLTWRAFVRVCTCARARLVNACACIKHLAAERGAVNPGGQARNAHAGTSDVVRAATLVPLVVAQSTALQCGRQIRHQIHISASGGDLRAAAL